MMGTAGVPAARCLYVFSCRYADIIATWQHFHSRERNYNKKMKKWMKICLMAAASAMLLAGCSTKDNAAGTTAVETTAKVEDTKRNRKKQIRQPRHSQ